MSYEEDCNALRPFIGAELPLAIERLRQQGYVVIPKERARFVECSRLITEDEAKIDDLVEHVKKHAAISIGAEMRKAGAILITQHLGDPYSYPMRVCIRAQARVIIPKPEEPADD